MAKFLITGAGGMLGQAVTREFQGRNHTVTALSHARLDITDLVAVKEALAEYTPEIIINCAAYTKVDQAETDYEAALQVNALGVRNPALACKETGAVLVHISTDYVFDGAQKEPWGIYAARNPLKRLRPQQVPGGVLFGNHRPALLPGPHLLALRPRRPKLCRNHAAVSPG